MFDSVVLNEASLPFESLEECEHKITSFFDLLHEAKTNNVQFSRADDLEGSWNHLNYANGFSFDKWLNAIEDKDRQRQIKSVISDLKCPLMSLASNRSRVDPNQVLFYHESNPDADISGLAFAHLNQSHSLSAPSKCCWQQDSVSMIKEWYENTISIKETVQVPNVSSMEQLAKFLDNFKALRQSNKSYLTSLKVKDNDDFPNLLFTESFLKSVRSVSLEPIDFKKLISVLKSLNSAILLSKSLLDLSHYSSLTITNESTPTMDNKTLARQRIFKHPILGNKTFEPHIKNFINYKRMHILPDYTEQKICIGYFGNHLKTSS